MLVESIVISLIIFTVVFIFLRAGKKDYAIAVLPLTTVSVAQVICELFGNYLSAIFGVELHFIIIIANLIGLMVSAIALGFFSHAINSKKARTGYLLLAGGFSVALNIIFIVNSGI